ncbi:MAG: Transcriptional regulator, GntR family [Rubritepida sp.]|nr:Transcriptional regulator, GntR family [Rubritepida sp.]
MAMKYENLVAYLEDGIGSGRFRPGERLPNQRELATQFGVTIATITRGIGEASRRGLVIARPGTGTFIRTTPEPAAPPDLTSEGIDLRLNSVPFPAGLRASLAEVLTELARDGRPEDIFGYQPATGAARHRAMVARWLQPRGLEASPERLLLTHGAQHALSACLAALTRPGDTVLCEAWTYAGFHRLAAEAGIRLVGIAMDGEGMLPEDLARQIRATGASLVLCSPAVHNPTMITMPLRRRREILEACRGTPAMLLEDDVYGHLAGDGIPPLAQLDPDRAIYVTGMSKAIAPAFRLGAVQAPARIRSAIQEALHVQHWVAPNFYAEVLARLVESGAAAASRNEHREEMRRRLAIAAAVLGPGRFAAPPLPSYHLWLPVPPPWRLDDFVRGLVQRGVRVLPSTHFAAGGAVLPAHIRACLGALEPAVLRQAFTAIGHLLTEQPWNLDAIT